MMLLSFCRISFNPTSRKSEIRVTSGILKYKTSQDSLLSISNYLQWAGKGWDKDRKKKLEGRRISWGMWKAWCGWIWKANFKDRSNWNLYLTYSKCNRGMSRMDATNFKVWKEFLKLKATSSTKQAKVSLTLQWTSDKA